MRGSSVLGRVVGSLLDACYRLRRSVRLAVPVATLALCIWPTCVLAQIHVPAVQGAGRSATPAITDVRFDESADGIRMSGNIRFTLPDTLRQTLDRGAPVYFLFETHTTRSRWYWSDKDVAVNRRYVRVLFQPLTQRWRVNVSSEPFSRGSVGVTLNQNYNSLDAALAVVRRISSWPVLDKNAWSSDSNYQVRARFRMDVSQLARPFQMNVGWVGGSLDVERTFRLTQQDLGKTVGAS